MIHTELDPSAEKRTRHIAAVPDRWEHAHFVQPARDLQHLHQDTHRQKAASVLLCVFLLVGVSAALSLLTGGILTRLMPDELAYIVGAALHVTIGWGVHYLITGFVRRNPRDKVVASICLAFSVLALLYVFVSRAILMVEEGRSPSFAWTISAFLVLVEIGIPALLGYALALASMAREDAGQEAGFFKHHQHLIESSGTPWERWNDAEDRLQDEMRERTEALRTAKPEGQACLNAEIRVLDNRFKKLREWNPTRAYRQ